jgi:hypothetical protein
VCVCGVCECGVCVCVVCVVTLTQDVTAVSTIDGISSQTILKILFFQEMEIEKEVSDGRK